MNWLRRLLGRRPSTPPPAAPSPAIGETFDFEDEPDYTEEEMKEAIERQSRSEARLQAEEVPLNPHLPLIETESRASFRSARETADRALALILLAALGEGLDRETFDTVVAQRGVADHFTPNELAYLRMAAPSEQASTQMVWRYKAANTLLWALQLVDGPLGRPDRRCDPAAVARIAHDTENLADKGLRPNGELLDEADLIYRYHWAARDASLAGQTVPANLDIDVIMERHHALNWLIGYCGLDWDDVTTDT